MSGWGTALEILVRNDITGLPVVDADGTVVSYMCHYRLSGSSLCGFGMF